MKGINPYRGKALSERRNGLWGNMFDDFFTDFLPMRGFKSTSFRLDVKETDKQYVVEAELPGVAKDDINIDLNEGTLTIAVRRDETVEEQNDCYVHRERRTGSMQRALYLPDVTREGASAKFENGVLSLTLEKQANAKQDRSITIE